MARYALTSLGIVLAGAFVLGCGTTWSVVRQASPDPMVGQGKFGILPIDYSQVRVGDKSEAGYLAATDERERSGFAEGKATLEETFRRTLRTAAGKRGVVVVAADGPGEAPFLIRPSVAFLQPGSGASRVEMDVKIVGADGEVVDEIQLSHSSDAQSGGRLRVDGQALGTLVADYVQSRVGKLDHAVDVSTEPEPAAPPAPTPPATPPPAPTTPPPPPIVAPPPPPIVAKGKRATPVTKRAAAKPKGKHLPVALPPPGTPIASSPSFTRLEDGKSRIWMEVSDKVEVVETRLPGRVTYRLRGAAVLPGTEQLALPTEFFTTPVSRVQLVPQGSDLDLIVDLREDFVPAYHMVDTPRGIVLQIDLPQSANFGHTDAPDTVLAPVHHSRSSKTLNNDTPNAPNTPNQQQPHHGRSR